MNDASSWTCVRLSVAQVAAGAKRKLARKALDVYRDAGEPSTFAVFATEVDEEGFTTVYLSPEAGRLLQPMIEAYGGTTCPTPSDATGLTVIAGAFDARDALLGES